MLSTLILTLLLLIGLFFFIRGSVKERRETVTLACQDNPDNILSYLRDYFFRRAYRVKSIHPEENKVVLEGLVAASGFLAVFLSFLAGCGLFCLGLVLSMLFQSQPLYWALGLTLLAPFTGWYYWHKARRVEQVIFRLDGNPETDKTQTVITIQAHRDELIELQKNFPFAYQVRE
ncbi:MAG: cofactor assembly of complex C subunit B [Geminocystis sp.]|nr:cofactor assembly of complex C subunit B [Geminocystis sp.]HIK38533.1 cofactor assembly of complex C subunit B [Geminocystis sp. M7585_C2015_104]MCS7147378.1 cofactor assembly of complex C subunit B [Geminocystis sp.]MCX8079040.1 cofactor assembly of complex C subunit B [Geminocystis sp.]MDW8117068.1 cofactor assembly of complex C subunit B [Geminocystis sp.]